ncbi:hypothetical protein, partial [Stenotrophomonas maltophilia]|uniref:hypothetical protein n=2 Tax=Gammaproteobacteria TaxID=1236 RepID=UPI001953AFA7
LELVISCQRAGTGARSRAGLTRQDGETHAIADFETRSDVNARLRADQKKDRARSPVVSVTGTVRSELISVV